jgi:alkylation response protein AidB-like acyl-CoA dehydrogenase
MDFNLTDDQQSIRDLAARILGERVTLERLQTIEGSPDAIDRDLWTDLANAGLLGLSVPEDVGGSGLGILELCLILEEVGRTVAPVPVLPTLVLGALPIAEFGSAAARKRYLPGVADGTTMLTAALLEPESEDPFRPLTTASEGTDGSWQLTGIKLCVPAANVATRVVTPATTEKGLGLFLVDPSGPGVSSVALQTTAGDPQSLLTLAGAPVAADEVLVVGDEAISALAWLVDRAMVGLCAMQVGLADRALRLTAQYTSEREQFGRPLATFQAVGQRAADAYIDVECIRWSMWYAAWRLSEGLPASDDVAIAKFWAAEGGQRVVSAAQHLHGGMGVDVNYPLHRYFRWSKQIELTLGSATRQLLRLGESLAEPLTAAELNA